MARCISRQSTTIGRRSSRKMASPHITGERSMKRILLAAALCFAWIDREEGAARGPRSP